MPEETDLYTFFNKEYYYSEAYTQYTSEGYAGTELQTIDWYGQFGVDCDIKCMLKILVESYLRVEHSDLSFEGSFRWYKPSSEMVDFFKLRYGMHNSCMYTVEWLSCFDSKEFLGEGRGFYIRKYLLNAFLNSKCYKAFWTVLGEKQLVSDSLYNRNKFSPKLKVISGLKTYDGHNSTGTITMFD